VKLHLTQLKDSALRRVMAEDSGLLDVGDGTSLDWWNGLGRYSGEIP
jgi:hypothetical protein